MIEGRQLWLAMSVLPGSTIVALLVILVCFRAVLTLCISVQKRCIHAPAVIGVVGWTYTLSLSRPIFLSGPLDENLLKASSYFCALVPKFGIDGGRSWLLPGTKTVLWEARSSLTNGGILVGYLTRVGTVVRLFTLRRTSQSCNWSFGQLADS